MNHDRLRQQVSAAIDQSSASARDCMPAIQVPEADVGLLATFAVLGMITVNIHIMREATGHEDDKLNQALADELKNIVSLHRHAAKIQKTALATVSDIDLLAALSAAMLGVMRDRYSQYVGREGGAA